MDRRTEILTQSASDTANDAALLKVERLPNETQETFSTRVAYAMHLQMEKPVSGRILLRMAYWAIRANLENQGYQVADLCQYRGSMTALVSKN